MTASAANAAPAADLRIDNVRIVDVLSGTVREGSLCVKDGRILGTAPCEARTVYDGRGKYLLPGLIDSHVHIESSMLSPAGFASLVLRFGTTTVIADPHEMANVRGEEAVVGLIDACRTLPLSVKVMVPSCVPALPCEDAGAVLDAALVTKLLECPDTFGLGEMMNVPGLLGGDPDANAKVEAARRLGKPVDGHAPLLSGEALEAYAAKGVMTDHECTTEAELRERIAAGMFVSIREGSLARDLALLLPALLPQDARALARRCTFCTDDRHAADTLSRGHINGMLAAAVRMGLDPVTAVQMATLNTAECYRLADRGAIAPGRRADLVLVDDLKDFRAAAVWCEGVLTAENEALVIAPLKDQPGFLAHTVNMAPVSLDTFALHAPSGRARMIGLQPHSLITDELIVDVKTREDGSVHLEDNPGLIKIAVIERHHATGKAGTALLDPRYGLKNGAIATSVSHDSHNIVVAGDNEGDMLAAVRALEAMEGGIVMVSKGEVIGRLALPVAGLMSDRGPEETAAAIRELITLADTHFGIWKESDAFMTLSFLALPVIPTLKITARGLFDLTKFAFVPTDAEETH